MKRLAGSDSNLDGSSDPFLQSKRIMAGSPFDIHRAEPSQQQPTKTPPLDVHRAESSRQHVRALNSQFASWVQSQLQNHPDELWEDGVRDYLAHASNIMEKFSDVVSWLKANAMKEDNPHKLESQLTPKKLVSESKDSHIKPFQEQSLFGLSGTTASSTPSWTAGIFKSQTPLTFGNQSLVPLNNDAADDGEGEELQQPSSPSVAKTEEKGIIVVHEVKCKLYVKSSDPADKDAWKDRGTGQLSIKCKEGITKGTRESRPTILVRNDVGKVLLNALLYPGIKTNMQKNSIVAIFHTADDNVNDGGESNSVVARTFLIRTKNEEDRNKLAAVIQEYAPPA